MTRVDRLREKKLGRLTEIGIGGQGRVYRTESRPGSVFKKYFSDAQVDSRALQTLVDLSRTVAASDPNDPMVTQAALPTDLVHDDAGRVVGFLMREVPDAYRSTIGRSLRLNELQYLLYSPKAIWGDVVLPTIEEKLSFLRDVAILFDRFHRRDLVIGDVSMRNVLWTCVERPSVFLIDSDGIRVVGESPAVATAETPDWDDPSLNGPVATLSSDRYKLALVVQRVLTQHAAGRPETLRDARDPEVPAQVWDLLAKVSSTGGTRPTAAHWIEALEGRGRIAVPRLTARPPRQRTIPEPERERIALRPRGSKRR